MNVPKSLISRLRGGKAGLVERLSADERSIALYTAEQLFAQAARGDVVLRGWGATCLLRPVPHVVCVRVTRSLAKRVEWLMGQLETDDAPFAEAKVRGSDEACASSLPRTLASANGASSVSNWPISHSTRFASERVTRTHTTCGTGRSRQVAPQPRRTTSPRAACANSCSAVYSAMLRSSALRRSTSPAFPPRSRLIRLLGTFILSATCPRFEQSQPLGDQWPEQQRQRQRGDGADQRVGPHDHDVTLRDQHGLTERVFCLVAQHQRQDERRQREVELLEDVARHAEPEH